VGADYEGLFEHDYSSTYRSPVVDGKSVPMIYGMDYHHLARDIHAEKGLWCIDCHRKQDIMGNGTLYSYQMEVPKRACEDCHGGFDRTSPDLSIAAIKTLPAIDKEGESEKETFLFISEHEGRKHRLPLFRQHSNGHNIEAHKRVRCSACHAQWSYQDYGLSVIREDLIEGYKWYRLTVQGDPYLESILEEHLAKPEKTYPVSKDWISGVSKPGVWSAGWRFRRWEFMPLGVDHENRYAILRPLYQYLITYVDRLGNSFMDSVIPTRGDGESGWASMPYVPHTTSPIGRSCDGCHQNRVAAGLGIGLKPTIDTSLTIPSPPAVSTMRLLNSVEKEKLMEPSHRYRKERLRALGP
jgi:hypothetical protein